MSKLLAGSLQYFQSGCRCLQSDCSAVMSVSAAAELKQEPSMQTTITQDQSVCMKSKKRHHHEPVSI